MVTGDVGFIGSDSDIVGDRQRGGINWRISTAWGNGYNPHLGQAIILAGFRPFLSRIGDDKVLRVKLEMNLLLSYGTVAHASLV